MATSSELQTLAIVSSEIDESEIKITFTNQCIKAQEALANKLNEEIQRRKEFCNLKKNENLKLEAEIRNAEMEIQNLRITHKTVKATNMVIKKDLLLAKEKKVEISERIRKGEKKYEELWLKSKERYETIPLVQKLIQNRKSADTLKNEIHILECEAQSFDKAISAKKDALSEKDQKTIVKFAHFLVHEMPAAILTLNEKNAFLNDLNKDIENFTINQGKNMAETDETQSSLQRMEEKTLKTIRDKWSFDETLMIPKLQLPSVDLDNINFKLDINKVTLHSSPVKRHESIIEFENYAVKRTKANEEMKDNYISCYLNKSANKAENNKDVEEAVDYSNKKLINILEDIKIDDNETYKIVAKTNIDTFKKVDVITTNKSGNDTALAKAAPLVIEEIEEIDLTTTNPQDVLIPPTQFLDLTQDNASAAGAGTQQAVAETENIATVDINSSKLKISQDSVKKVSFEIPEIIQDKPEDMITEHIDTLDENPNNDTISQLNLSTVSDDNYMAIKDMILKKHNLDLSPQFVYAKNTILQKNDEVNVKSKFFEPVNNKVSGLDLDTTAEENMNWKLQEMEQPEKPQHKNNDSKVDTDLAIVAVDNAMMGSEPTDKPITGLLFTHGPQGITDLDISMSTTGYEEGDSEFPNCLDSSLLLSPKADLPLPMSGNDSEVTSQDVPNFLSGLKKSGLSFFKQCPMDSNAESSMQNQENNFNFNFGGTGDEKKTRGGLFSFFR